MGVTWHTDCITWTTLLFGQRVKSIQSGNLGTVISVKVGYNRRGDPCFRVKVAWDNGKLSTVSDYSLIAFTEKGQ